MSFKIVYDDGDIYNNPPMNLNFYLKNRENNKLNNLGYEHLKCKFIPKDAKINGK